MQLRRQTKGSRGSRAGVLAIAGTRPEVIKLAPVIRSLHRLRTGSPVKLCVINQQHDILRQALADFHLTPDFDIQLDLRRFEIGDTLGSVVDSLLPVIEAMMPAIVVVQGDTMTTLGGALAARYLGIPVAHVEAGLRSSDGVIPFPEETNRFAVDHISSVLYAPTERARDNLLQEDIAPASILVTGNTVVDALRAVPRRSPRGQASDPHRKLLLVTGHRRESFDGPAEDVCSALRTLVTTRPDLSVVYVTHPNPKAAMPPQYLLAGMPRTQVTPPMSYPQFINLLRQAFLAITDSGGIQEEAPYLGVPVLVTREETERQEALEMGVARLVGTDRETIIHSVLKLADDPGEYAAMARRVQPFGKGNAASCIARELTHRLEPATDAEPERAVG